MPVVEYAEMNAANLVGWILVATVAGIAARRIVQGKAILGLWGDMAIGLLGAFALGWALKRFGFDLSQTMLEAAPGITSSGAIWLDVLAVAFVGALVLRILLRIAKQ
ncbi:MAG: GlsB/YeaQ/YmgE family stress response membrane protein [Maricaulaceae bacterium]|jgi:uncharacterized membrane protein YeaQ/YmgE (transglycosylase-associated protein family)